MGDTHAAREAFERAVTVLGEVKDTFVPGSYRTFSEYVSPVYRDF